MVRIQSSTRRRVEISNTRRMYKESSDDSKTKIENINKKHDTLDLHRPHRVCHCKEVYSSCNPIINGKQRITEYFICSTYNNGIILAKHTLSIYTDIDAYHFKRYTCSWICKRSRPVGGNWLSVFSELIQQMQNMTKSGHGESNRSDFIKVENKFLH
jgi:phosphatidylserine decarboxylase